MEEKFYLVVNYNNTVCVNASDFRTTLLLPLLQRKSNDDLHLLHPAFALSSSCSPCSPHPNHTILECFKFDNIGLARTPWSCEIKLNIFAFSSRFSAPLPDLKWGNIDLGYIGLDQIAIIRITDQSAQSAQVRQIRIQTDQN